MKFLISNLVLSLLALNVSSLFADRGSALDQLYREARIKSDENLMFKAYLLSKRNYSKNPNDLNACIWKGKLENSVHAFEFSEATFKECYQIKPDPEIKGFLAEIYIHQGRLKEARDALRSSAKSGFRFMYFARLAMLEKAEGHLDKSHKSWDAALESYDRMDPEPPAWVLVEIGDLYRLQGHNNEAIANFKKSLSLVPNYEPALRGLKAIRSKSSEALLHQNHNSINRLVNTGS